MQLRGRATSDTDTEQDNIQDDLVKLMTDQNREIIERLDRLERLQSRDLVKGELHH